MEDGGWSMDRASPERKLRGFVGLEFRRESKEKVARDDQIWGKPGEFEVFRPESR